MLSLARTSVREPWSRRADESVEDYLRFTDWLHTENRGLPVAQAVALEYDWAGRARAYDELFRCASTDPLEIARRNWGTILALESTKLAHALAQRPAPLRSSDGYAIRDLIELTRLLAELPPLEDGELQITDETREEAERLVAKIRKMRRTA